MLEEYPTISTDGCFQLKNPNKPAAVASSFAVGVVADVVVEVVVVAAAVVVVE